MLTITLEGISYRYIHVDKRADKLRKKLPTDVNKGPEISQK